MTATGRRALVTGATGFVGSHLVEALIAREWTVRCTMRDRSNSRWLDGLAIERVGVDWRDAASLARATSGVDVVFHVAALLSGATESDLMETNVALTGRLLAGTPEGVRFVFVSSLAASGPAPNDRPLVETDPCRPVSAYGRSKAAAEALLWREQGARPVSVVRPPIVIGPRDTGLLPLVQMVQRGVAVRIGAPKRVSFVFVEDLVEGLIAAAEPAGAGHTFFMAHPEPIAHEALLQAIAQALRRRPLWISIPDRLVRLAGRLAQWVTPGGRFGYDKSIEMTQASWACSPAAAKERLGWEARTGLSTAIERCVAAAAPHERDDAAGRR
jgi:dihydroflavonol-4-reductase